MRAILVFLTVGLIGWGGAALAEADQQLAQRLDKPSPCLCAQACALRGRVFESWTDASGQNRTLAGCPHYRDELLYDNWVNCSCSNPAHWYGSSSAPITQGRESPNH